MERRAEQETTPPDPTDKPLEQVLRQEAAQ